MYLSVALLFSNDYKRDWDTYGNIYAEYSLIDLSEKEINKSNINDWKNIFKHIKRNIMLMNF